MDEMPKNVFVKRSVLEMGVNSAVLEFNNGAVGIGKVLQQCKVAIRVFTFISSGQKDKWQQKLAQLKTSGKCRARRKMRRGIKKGFLNAEKEKEHVEPYKSEGY